MGKVFVSPEEQKLIDVANRPRCDSRSFLVAARRHPKSVILTYYRAMCAAHGLGMRRSPALAKRWLERVLDPIRSAAEEGDALAQNCMGVLYSDRCVAGMVVPHDGKEAVKWFRRSARQGCLKGQLNLGDAYREGWWVSKSFARAVKWYERSAQQGCFVSMIELGLIYHRGGFGIRQDYEKSFFWTRQAAESGVPAWLWFLGGHYFMGKGVEKDRVMACELFKKAAEGGFAPAQTLLGFIYWCGREAYGKDLNKARYWFEKAAEQGNERAKKYLEVMPKDVL